MKPKSLRKLILEEVKRLNPADKKPLTKILKRLDRKK